MSNLRLLNEYEEITFDRLEVGIGHSAHVFPKVRLADIFPIRNSGISNEEYSYCLKSHFDFLITDKNYLPLFSVEYDGSFHRLDKHQIENDKIKNAMCERFSHPILRINSLYITKEYKGIDLLTYFIDVWFFEKAFDDAQRSGVVSFDEVFDPCFIASDGKDRKWPYWLSSEIQVKIRSLHRLGKIEQAAPSHWVGIDDEGNYRCICWVEVGNDKVVFVKTGMRKQYFQAVLVSDLLSMLAMFDLDKKLEKYFLDESIGVTTSDFRSILNGFCSELEPRQLAKSGSIACPI
ncbi:DUF2726 domain-containing protein [Pleionea sp. CnH1-48]|uniref:DUF2726 domain-containing protein n=1 Tax=Pleionea sp. CnH1-48 TaxID=2954494 RepID=UPI002096C318|nr:DUF2726 domain-containing protein [Pleionea sp. CnH1-48]MCO7222701.1 DUF2726 domain-containing protein [Pleionea sp. CnH1-48]